MKIAFVTDDGKTISQHFGRATHYLVATLENSQVVSKEMRPKLGHNHFSQTETGHHEHQEHHGSDGEGHAKHVQMAEAISDCEALICGGMGMGAYQSMLQLNIKPMVTELTDIDQAVQAYQDGKLIDHIERLH